MKRIGNINGGIMVGENYKVTADNMNITLWERGVVKGTARNKAKIIKENIGNEYWKALFYFNDYAELLKALARYEIHGVGLADLEKVTRKQEEIYKLIEDTLKNKPIMKLSNNGG